MDVIQSDVKYFPKILQEIYMWQLKKLFFLFMESLDRKDYIRKTNTDHICKH